MTLTLSPGAFGVDAYGNNNFDADALEAAGVTFLTGYVCQDNGTTHSKIIRPDVWARLERFTRILNYEWYEGRCIVPGVGTGDAQLVLRYVDSGLPTDVVIVSCDMNVGGVTIRGEKPVWTRPDELPVCATELAAHQRVYATRGIRLGVYGGGWLLQWLIWNGAEYGLDASTVLWWQPPMAWSPDGAGGYYIPDEVHILQAGGSVIGGVSVDHNRVVRRYSTAVALPPPTAPILEDSMSMRVFDTAGTKTLVVEGEMRHLPLETDVAQWLAALGQASPGPLHPWMWADFYWRGPVPTYPDDWAGPKYDPAALCRPRSGGGSAPSYVGDLGAQGVIRLRPT